MSNLERKLRRGPSRGVSRRKRPKTLAEVVSERTAAALMPKGPRWAGPAPSILHRWCDEHAAWHAPGERHPPTP